MDTAAFDYDLPEARIAQEPVEPRDSARLLVDVAHGTQTTGGCATSPTCSTRVTWWSSTAPGSCRPDCGCVKPTGGAVEVLLLDPARPHHLGGARASGPAGATGTRAAPPGGRRGRCRVTVGDVVGDGIRLVELTAAPRGRLSGRHRGGRGGAPAAVHPRRRSSTPSATRPCTRTDPSRSRRRRRPPGCTSATRCSTAARRGVQVVDVELIVGLGTFRPIEVDKVEDHQMHAERYGCRPTTRRLRRHPARGGTWSPSAPRRCGPSRAPPPTGELEGRTELFIHAGYDFRVVDRLMTNFHLPRSSLLVMIDAFVGPRGASCTTSRWPSDYRFLSFGDAMLLDP